MPLYGIPRSLGSRSLAGLEKVRPYSGTLDTDSEFSGTNSEEVRLPPRAVGEENGLLLESIENENGFVNAADNLSEEIIIQRIGRVGRNVVVRISEECRVRDHQGRKPLAPE